MTTLPVAVTEMPHWRINLRTEEYREQRIARLGDCMAIVEATKVQLRGWDYPHLSRRPGHNGQGNDYVDSWSDSPGHVEYWRFYQSAQFLHLFNVREAAEPQWAAKLKQDAAWHIGSSEVANVPGFFSLLNVIYTVTEVFEFASRLSQRSVYDGTVIVDIRIRGASGFGIIPDVNRAWSELRCLSSDDVGRAWSVPAADLLASTAQHALEAVLWLFERFGWFDPPRHVIAKDQERFLKGLL